MAAVTLKDEIGKTIQRLADEGHTADSENIRLVFDKFKKSYGPGAALKGKTKSGGVTLDDDD